MITTEKKCYYVETNLKARGRVEQVRVTTKLPSPTTSRSQSTATQGAAGGARKRVRFHLGERSPWAAATRGGAVPGHCIPRRTKAP